MLLNLFNEKPWVSIGCWAAFFCLDYALTLWAARMYQAKAGKHYSFSGGYELNEFFKDDIAKLRPFSFRFFLMLLFVVGLMLIGFVSGQEMFEFTWGMFIGMQLSVLFRHILNLTMFYYASRSAGIEGRIQMEHWLSLRLAAIESLTFSLVFLAIYLLADKTFLLGASAGCLLLALRMLVDSYKQRRASVSSPKDG